MPNKHPWTDHQKWQWYTTLVNLARNPEWFTSWGVPDHVDGRYEVLVVHLFCVMECLRRHADQSDGDHRKIARLLLQEWMDMTLAYFEESVRRQGPFDKGLKRRMKPIMEGLNGRLMAYHQAIQAQDHGDSLKQAIVRNIFRGVVPQNHKVIDDWAQFVSEKINILCDNDDVMLMMNNLKFMKPKTQQGDDGL